MKQWSEIQTEFEIDGSLRDIYAEDIDPSIWDLFISEVKRANYTVEFSHGDDELDLPDNFKTIRGMQQTNPTTLYIWPSEGIQLNCHFFVDTEIELDVSPHDIKSEDSYIRLVAFLKWLAQVTSRERTKAHKKW